MSKAWKLLVLLGLFGSGQALSAEQQHPPVYVSSATGIAYQHGYAFLSTPKYPPEATHFDYVNPDAPKGGLYRSADMGTWDSFNPIPLRGRLVRGTSYWVKEWQYLWDSLLRDALDESATYYGLIAEGVAVADDGAWIAFKLRDAARWHDGTPLTVRDVAYTFEISTTIANPDIVQGLDAFSGAEIIADNEIKFHVKPEARGNPMLPIRIGQIPIMPKHYWASRDISKTTVEPPLGSAAYKIGEFSVGRWVEWKRVEDYWGKDLPVNKGHHNFGTVRIDYFRDDQVVTEAVKGHLIDIHIESVPRTWFAAYETPGAKAGLMKKMKVALNKPAGMWWTLFFNTDQKRFLDIRVREALWLLGDYEWGAKRSYNFYGQATSFFTGSELASSGLPSELELELLEPLRDKIPARVFTHEYTAPPNQGNGYNRHNVLKAAALLREAGWVVRNHVLVHEKTGEPFEVRLLAVSAELGRSMIPYTRRLARLGIKARISAPEISNWLYRMRSGDFDIGSIWFLPAMPPTNLVERQFLSVGADQDYSYNWSNMRDEAVDALISAMRLATSYDKFVAAGRALDRVLLWNFYFVPSGSKTEQAYVYWDKFTGPDYAEPLSRHSVQLTWWYDAVKAAQIAKFVGED